MAKKRLATGITFDASAKTIVHADFSDITLAGIQLITNVTDNIVIYNFADPLKGGTLSTDTLTLDYDTTSMSDTDELMVLVEDGVATQGVTGTVTANAGTNLNTSTLAVESGGNLAAIKAKTDNIPALGQALAAASVPVVLTAAQEAALTPPAAITGFATEAKQDTIIGHVDGIETVLGTIDADTSNISTKIDTLAGAVDGTEVQVDVVSLPTVTANATLAAETTKVIGTVNVASGQTIGLAAGSAAIGKLAANSGVDIGDVDVTSLPALPAGTNNIGDVDIASALPAGDNNIGNVDLASAIPAGTNAIGKLLPPDVDVTAHTNYIRKYYTNAGAVTDGIIWSPAAGKRWHVTWLYIQTSAAATVTLEDDKAGGDDPVWKSELAANSGAFLTFPEKYPMASGEDAADLTITTSAGNIYVSCGGYEI